MNSQPTTSNIEPMQLEKSTPITGGKTSFLQRINQQIPFVNSNLKFMSGLSLIVFGTVLQLALKNSTSKAGTVFKVIGGMCIFGGLIIFLLSLLDILVVFQRFSSLLLGSIPPEYALTSA